MPEMKSERAIRVLLYLTSHRPAEVNDIRKAIDIGPLRFIALIGILGGFGMVKRVGRSDYEITDAGRYYLYAFDELDQRAPYATFDRTPPLAPKPPADA